MDIADDHQNISNGVLRVPDVLAGERAKRALLPTAGKRAPCAQQPEHLAMLREALFHT